MFHCRDVIKEMCIERNYLSWDLISQNDWVYLLLEFQPLKFPTSVWIKIHLVASLQKWQSKYIHILVHLQYLKIW